MQSGKADRFMSEDNVLPANPNSHMIRVIFLLGLVFLFPSVIYARFDPFSVPNNKYGIHVVDPNDIPETSALVNSAGGDWGYVTLVIQEDDRNREKWQSAFNQMRSRHLIPIVRLATHIDGDSWTKPYNGSANDWARFLDSLNWPIENRYVVLFNEPNHANEWGKSIDPEDYAKTLVQYARVLHETSEDFFVLPAGLDVSAASDGRSLDAQTYLSRMLRTEPKLLSLIDGWTSHSYPNPAFSGSPFATGRGSLRSYQWELATLRNLGLNRTLPVFITETGWVHADGVSRIGSNMSPERVAENYRIAASAVWPDSLIVAVTPFVYNYQGLPFDHFSWKKLGSNTFYPQYFTYKDIPKLSGRPVQREKFTLDTSLFPNALVAGSTYTVSSLMKNEGQGIYTERDKEYRIEFVTTPRMPTVTDPIPDMEPGQFGTLTMHVETPNLPGDYPYKVEVVRGEKRILVEEGKITLVPPPSLDLSVQLGWRTENTALNATVLIYDHNTLIHKFQGIEIRNGKGVVTGLRNVVPDSLYRVVVLVPYYLPRQRVIRLGAETTAIRLARMLPLDFDQDGALTFKDAFSAFKLQPNFVRSLFVRP